LAEKLRGNPKYLLLKEKARLFLRGQAPMSQSEIDEHEQYVASQIKENERTFNKLILVLEDFYKSNPSNKSEPVQLEIRKGPWNQSRIQPKGMPSLKVKEVQSYWPEEQKAENLAAYRREMDRFAQFLKTKFFLKT
jgi:hypothetical protein